MGDITAKYPLYSGGGEPISGTPWLSMKIRKDDDGKFLDFDDNVFKDGAWVEKDKTMTEPDAVNIPGEYEWKQAVAVWDDGAFTIYYDWDGPEIPKFTDSEQKWVSNGVEVGPGIDFLKEDTVIIKSKADDIKTQTNDIETKTDVVDTKVVTVKVDTTVVTGIITDDKIAAQVEGMDEGTTTAEVLADDAVDKIVDAIFAKVIDGTQNLQEVLTILFALAPGKKLVKDGTEYTYYDQDGNVVLTIEWSATEAVATL